MREAEILPGIQAAASYVSRIPVLSRISPSAAAVPDQDVLAGFQNAQRLAFEGTRAVGAMLQEGWSERKAADLLNEWLQDHGVRSFFHRSFVWWGDRTRFAGVRTYAEYGPGKRALRAGDVYILDVAPIVNGFACDIGHSAIFGDPSEAYTRAMGFLRELRHDIPQLFNKMSGQAVCAEIARRITAAGYENIHETYPFSVLGHRIHAVPTVGPDVTLLNFGWRSYWSLLSRGLFGQLLNRNYRGQTIGLWAIEPHIATPAFGVKFEEILVVTPDGAHWLDKENPDVDQ